MEKILIINPFGIGDVLFTTPVVANLRQAYPKARIVYLANRRCAAWLEHNPKIDQVMVYERDEFKAAQRNFFAYGLKWLAFFDQIKKERFDAVFDFSLNRAFGGICLAAGVPRRIGYDFKFRGVFLNHRYPLAGYEGRHVVEHYLDLLRDQNIPTPQTRLELFLAPGDEEWAQDWLKKQGIGPDSRVIAVVPGGGASWGGRAQRKRWPAAKFAQLVDKVVADLKAAVILMGDAKEEALCQEIARLAHHPLDSAVGQTSLTQMAALFKRCRLVIANDGGPLHVAVAAGAQTVGIFGPVDEVVYGPYPRNGHDVATLGLACQPCYRNFFVAPCEHMSCLQNLPVERVYNLVQRKVQVKS